MNNFRYIEKLIYKEQNVEKELNFEPGINVVIGPKGGGKSLLLKILWALKTNYKIEKEIKALRSFDISDLRIKLSDSDQLIGISESNDYKWSDKKANIDNFLKQSDEIKIKLDSTSLIMRSKELFLYQIIEENVEELTNKFKKTIDNYRQLPDIFEEWLGLDLREVFWKIKDTKKDDFITMINNFLFKEPINIRKSIISDIKNIILYNNESIKLSKFLNKELQDYKFLNDDSKEINEYVEILKEQKILFENKLEKLEKYNKMIEFYNNSIKLIKNKFKESKKNEEAITMLQANSKKEIIKIAKKLFEIKELFIKLNEKTKIELFHEMKLEELKNFNLYIKETININDFELKQEILKFYLNSPNKKENWIDWVEKNIKNIKNLPKKEIKSKIIEEVLQDYERLHEKKLIDCVEIIDTKTNKKYSDMSLGERSILGIKNKLNQMAKNSFILFLDQLEDNLDNFSIQNTIVKLLNEISETKQIFVVTHNANIGINTNVYNIIVAKLNKDSEIKEQYKNINIKTEIIKTNLENSDLVYYLEGGKKALKDRFEKIFKKQ